MRELALVLVLVSAGVARAEPAGSATTTVVPRPSSLAIVIVPPRPLTMPWQIDSSRPVPSPIGFVV